MTAPLCITPARRWLRVALLLFAALAGAGSHAAEVAAAPPQHILLLYAYGYGGRGVELFSDGFFKVITAAGFPVSNIHAEYLDLQRNHAAPGYRQELRALLRGKYAQQRIDLIVTLQQPALEFLLIDGTEIAPLAPVITIQHRPLLEAEKTGRRIVGEVNQFDIKGTLERALELFPQTRRVLVASGSSAADVKVAEEVARVAEPWRGRLEFEFTTGRTLDEILHRAGSLPPHSIVVFTQYNRDAKGRVALAYEAENMIVKAANAPVFGFYDYNLKNGGIGGSVIAVEASGARSGRLALDILRGASPQAGGTLKVNENIPMFDWPQVQRWGGDVSRLPANTVFLNRAPSLWQQYGTVIVGTLAFILAQSGLIAVLLINIRRRRRAENVLGESEANFQAVFGGIADSVVFGDTTRHIRLVNPAFTRLFGYSADEVIGRTGEFLYVVAADYVEQGRRRFHSEAGGESGVYQLRYRRKDGSEFWAETSGTQIRGPDGSVTGLMAMYRDITERKQAELALRKSKDLLRCVVENVPARVFWKDRDSRYLGCNIHFAKDAGRSRPDELVGETDFEMGWKDQAELYRADDRAVMDSGVPKLDFEEPSTAPDGTLHWLRTSKVPLRDESHQVIGILGVYEDITARKRTEDQLRKLAQAVEQSPESILITDLDARIEYVNQAFVANSGYSREELIGQNPRILQSGRTPPETRAALWQAMRAGLSWRGEFYNRRKDGSDYVEFAIVTPLRQADGRTTHYVAVQEDITEKKRIGEELDHHRRHLEELVAERTGQLSKAKEQAEAANRAKSTFLANMSHEIRTPMNAIVGLTHLLRRSAATPRQAERLTKVEAAAHHLLAIINDILDLSKIEAGNLQLERIDFTLDQLFGHVTTLVERQATDKGLQVEVDTDGVPQWLNGDLTRLRQALLNYVGNAVKFTAQGRITLRARLLESDADGMLVHFEVEDSGIGIAPEIRGRLFEAFEQADTSTTRKYGGTGLGLAITRRLALLMGGEAGAASEAGQGSRFWFTARLERGRGAMPVAEPVRVVDDESELRRCHGGARLLLVEDDAINREVALELLRDVDLVVDTASNGRKALARVNDAAYDLILMDMQMPELDGLAATREIRRLPGRAALPIIAMTASAFEDDRRACLQAGMNDYVAKPVVPGRLYAVLLKWLPRKTQARRPVTDAAQIPLGVSLPADLAAIPGLDPDQGLSIARNRPDRLLRLFGMFVENHGAEAAQLESLCAAGNYQELGRRAHDLTGVAGNLGAVRVQEAAQVLLTALATGAGPAHIEQSVRHLAQLLHALIAAIGQLPASGTPPAAPTDTRRAAHIVAQLERLLESGNIRANELANVEAATLREALGEAAAEILRRIADFDYEGALRTLRQPGRIEGASQPPPG